MSALHQDAEKRFLIFHSVRRLGGDTIQPASLWGARHGSMFQADGSRPSISSTGGRGCHTMTARTAWNRSISEGNRMEPMRCRDLRPGDIMLKVINKKDPLTVLIGSLQMIFGAQRPFIVHAGIMFDNTYIIEAQGPGISGNDMRVQNKNITYVVYRCTRPNIARGAGTCAKMMFDIHQRRRNKTHKLKFGSKTKQWRTGGSMQYSLFGAAGSLLMRGSGTAKAPAVMDDLLTDILEGKSHKFFCSQFVIYAYQFVGVQCGLASTAIFPMSDAKVDPSMLASKLSTSGYFKEQGVMMPGIR